MIGIYKITNKITGKSYIGQSVNIATRWSAHKSTSRSEETLDGNELHKDMLTLGVDNFSFEVIEETTVDKLNEREIYWIQYYNTYYDGYNRTLGGNGSRLDYNKIKELWEQGLTSKEIAPIIGSSRNTINQALTNLGITTKEKQERSEELIKNSVASYKRSVSKIDIETNKIIEVFDSVSAAAKAVGVCKATFRKGLQKHNNIYKGYKWFINTATEKTRDFSAKQVIKLDPITKEPLEYFESVSAAARSVNLNGGATLICKACKNGTKSGGFLWKYNT